MSEHNEVSRSYEPPICKCEHFKVVHDSRGCAACDCMEFAQVKLDETKLGKAMDAFLKGEDNQ